MAHGLNALGELTRWSGDLDTAIDAYRQAREVNQAIGDRYYEAINVANTGMALMAAGELREALPYYVVGLELSARVGSRIMLAWGVSESALPARLLGRPELAARLIGSAETALDLFGATRTPADQVGHEQTVVALVAELGSARFDELLLQGREMNLEQATQQALEMLQEADPSPDAAG